MKEKHVKLRPIPASCFEDETIEKTTAINPYRNYVVTTKQLSSICGPATSAASDQQLVSIPWMPIKP